MRSSISPPGTGPDRWSTHRATVHRLMRYSAVSVVATSTSLVILGLLVGLLGTPAVWANVVATAVGTVPSFELNRRWVWSAPGGRSVLGQIVPFCALSFTGLVVSTMAVGEAAARTAGWGRWSHTVAVLAANVIAYGSLWVIQYLLLDRMLFGNRARPGGGLDRHAGSDEVPMSARPRSHDVPPSSDRRPVGAGRP